MSYFDFNKFAPDCFDIKDAWLGKHVIEYVDKIVDNGVLPLY